MALYALHPDTKYCKYTHTSYVNCDTVPPTWGAVVSSKTFLPCTACIASEEQAWTVEVDGEGKCLARKVECVGPCDPECCPNPPTEPLPTIAIPSECCDTVGCFEVWVSEYDPTSEVWGTPTRESYECVEVCPPQDDEYGDPIPHSSGIDFGTHAQDVWKLTEGCFSKLWRCAGSCDPLASEGECETVTNPPPTPTIYAPDACECNAAMEQFNCQSLEDNCENHTRQTLFDSYLSENGSCIQPFNCNNLRDEQSYQDYLAPDDGRCRQLANSCTNPNQQANYTAHQLQEVSWDCDNLRQTIDGCGTGPGIGFSAQYNAIVENPSYLWSFGALSCCYARAKVEMVYRDTTGNPPQPTGDVKYMTATVTKTHHRACSSGTFSQSGTKYIISSEITWDISPQCDTQTVGSIVSNN